MHMNSLEHSKAQPSWIPRFSLTVTVGVHTVPLGLVVDLVKVGFFDVVNVEVDADADLEVDVGVTIMNEVPAHPPGQRPPQS
jgi:hypothetical protein